MPELKDTFLKIYDELEKVGDLLLHALEPKLGVKDGFFKETTRDGNSILRLLHYPPIPADADPNAERAKAHYDINTITLLVSGSSSGLQVKSKETGEWIPIEADAESITVNMGDMLSRICNDELPSTLHRVVNPDPSKNIVRYSMPFFLHFRNEVVLKCLPKFKGSGEKYPEITAGEFLNERLKEIGLKK
jgi:isopenicillin N synthase-like dioxygenase